MSDDQKLAGSLLQRELRAAALYPPPPAIWKSLSTQAADALDARDAEIARLRGLLWYGWSEMNAIRAESGVPRSYDGSRKGISENYWSDVVYAMADALGDEAQPWPSENARTALNGGNHVNPAGRGAERCG
jgi:hypothetical protein